MKSLEKTLILGKGSREHALYRKLEECGAAPKIWPGSAAQQAYGLVETIHCDGIDDPEFIKKIDDLGYKTLLPGSEEYLAAGLVDRGLEVGWEVVGPQKSWAQLEADKDFAKKWMQDHRLPTAAFRVFEQVDEAFAYAQTEWEQKGAVVLKACGLAAGKGVFVCKNLSDLATAKVFFQARTQESILVEDCLEGVEFSHFLFFGQDECISLGTAFDYKRKWDQDKGPNTGGMGSFTFRDSLPLNVAEDLEANIIQPIRQALLGTYHGLLYLGLMATERGCHLLEFNVRLGDPEAQVLLLDKATRWMAEPRKRFEHHKSEAGPSWAAVGVVISSQDYAEAAEGVGRIPVDFYENRPSHIEIFLGGCQKDANYLSGKGRMMTVCSQGADLEQARAQVYDYLARHERRFEFVHFRKDIGLEPRFS